eukprot:jgi/Picsp_1/6415/NSC_03763-R1_---NA---
MYYVIMLDGIINNLNAMLFKLVKPFFKSACCYITILLAQIGKSDPNVPRTATRTTRYNAYFMLLYQPFHHPIIIFTSRRQPTPLVYCPIRRSNALFTQAFQSFMDPTATFFKSFHLLTNPPSPGFQRTKRQQLAQLVCTNRHCILNLEQFGPQSTRRILMKRYITLPPSHHTECFTKREYMDYMLALGTHMALPIIHKVLICIVHNQPRMSLCTQRSSPI